MAIRERGDSEEQRAADSDRADSSIVQSRTLSLVIRGAVLYSCRGNEGGDRQPYVEPTGRICRHRNRFA